MITSIDSLRNAYTMSLELMTKEQLDELGKMLWKQITESSPTDINILNTWHMVNEARCKLIG